MNTIVVVLELHYLHFQVAMEVIMSTMEVEVKHHLPHPEHHLQQKNGHHLLQNKEHLLPHKEVMVGHSIGLGDVLEGPD